MLPPMPLITVPMTLTPSSTVAVIDPVLVSRPAVPAMMTPSSPPVIELLFVTVPPLSRDTP